MAAARVQDLDSDTMLTKSSEEVESDTSGDEIQVEQSAKPAQERHPPLKIEKFKPARSSIGKKLKVAAKQRSEVWAHFIKFDAPIIEIVDGKDTQVGTQQRAQCKYCPTTFKCDSRANGTSSLAKHIKKIYKGYQGRPNIENQKLLGSNILDPNNSMVTRVWSEETCLDAACVMIVLDELAFSFIERPGFLHFSKVAVPKWIPPCRKVIVKNLLRMYDVKKLELMKQLRSHTVCLTTDTWTSCQNINYMVITGHFIDMGWNMHKLVLNFCVIPNYSGISIGKILENCLLDWKLDKVLTISLDNAAANKVAIEYLVEQMNGWSKPPMFGGKYMHIRCLAHILNLIVRFGLHMLNKSVASIRNAVRYVRSIPQRLETFKACVEATKIPCKRICVLDVLTRWNSTYLMLDTALELKKAFNRMADEEDGRYRSYFEEDEDLSEEDDTENRLQFSNQQKKRVGLPVASDWEKASVFVKYLKVFLDATLDVSTQLKPTSHKAFMNIATIKAEVEDIYIKPFSGDSSETGRILHNMANKMRLKFRKYFGSLNDIHELYLVAFVLDPRYNLKGVQLVCGTMLDMGSEDIKKKSDDVKSRLLELCDIYASLEGQDNYGESSAYKRKRSMGEGTSSGMPTQDLHSLHSAGLAGKKAAMLEVWNKQLEGETTLLEEKLIGTF